MNYDLQKADLSAVLSEGRLLADETKRIIGTRSAAQINWKPSEEEWSIGQCFDHLIISNRPYFSIVDKILQGERRPRLWERMPLLPALFARLLIETLLPDSGRKVKARKAFYPSSSQIDPSIVTSFLEQQDRLLHLMEVSRGVDLEGITITSPVSSFITYSLMDAYRIVVFHEQNHFVQAKRMLEMPGFPT